MIVINLVKYWIIELRNLTTKGFLFRHQSTTVYFSTVQYGMCTIQCVIIVCEKNE